MPDNVNGIVTGILGGDTLEIQVINEGIFNENEYRNAERIRIAGIDDPDLYPGKSVNGNLAKLKDREVRCFVLTRDANGNVVAVVQCVN